MMKKAVNSRKFDVSCGAVNKFEPEPERIDVSEFLTTEVIGDAVYNNVIGIASFQSKKTTTLALLFHLLHFSLKRATHVKDSMEQTLANQYAVLATIFYFHRISIFPKTFRMPRYLQT